MFSAALSYAKSNAAALGKQLKDEAIASAEQAANDFKEKTMNAIHSRLNKMGGYDMYGGDDIELNKFRQEIGRSSLRDEILNMNL